MSMDVRLLTVGEITTMSEDDFTLLLFALGPIPEPTPATVYMPQQDWLRILDVTGWAEGCGQMIAFAKRVNRIREGTN